MGGGRRLISGPLETLELNCRLGNVDAEGRDEKDVSLEKWDILWSLVSRRGQGGRLVWSGEGRS